MQPWFRALGIPYEGSFMTGMDGEGEWYTEWDAPSGVHPSLHPATQEEWKQGKR